MTLAERITQEAKDPYLKGICLAKLSVPQLRYALGGPGRSTIDFVTNFLLNTREGYCTSFASAMAVRHHGGDARPVCGRISGHS